MTTRTPAPPRGAGTAGKKLWTAVLADWELEAHELVLLREAVRTVDALDKLHRRAEADGLVIDSKAGLKAHPALVEARQLRIALARLLAALRLPDGEEGAEGAGRRQRRVGARGVYAVGKAS